MLLATKHCVPCEGGANPLTDDSEDGFLGQVGGWVIDRTAVHTLRKAYKFRTFLESVDFVNSLARVAETEQHHPVIHLNCRTVTVEVWTHAILGLSENDFILAAKADAAAGAGH